MFLPFLLLGQGEYNQWRFGYGSGLNFNGGSVSTIGSAINSEESAASVSDCSGNLLFYTDGQNVWGKNNSIMDGGYNLRGIGLLYPCNQGALIVKRPNSISTYYIFTSSDRYGINYSTVNMLQNGGNGKVTQKNIKLSGSLTQKLGVTYHQNGEDIWVITHYENSNVYEAFLITKTGVSPATVKSAVGPKFTSSHGDIKFNQQGTKVGAVVQDQNLITLADFNNATGKVSNSYGIIGRYNSPHGCEFSPSGNKFYISAWGRNGGVIQFMVGANNSSTISSSSKNISFDFRPNGSLQLAPDGKIYVAHNPEFWSSESYLGVISFPENNGSLASFNRYGLYLGRSGSSWMLPNVTLTNNNIPKQKKIEAEQFCYNSETKFNLSNTSAVVEVVWDFDDINSNVSNFSSDLAPSHLFSSPGTYNVKATITNVCEIEEYNKIIVIDEGPVSYLDSLQVCRFTDSNIGFSSNLGVTYSWKPNQGLSQSNISNPSFNSKTLEGDEFEYVLISSSPGGCIFEDTLKIKLFKKEKAGDNQILCPGFAVTLTTDSGVVSAVWQGDNINDTESLNPIVTPPLSSSYFAELTDTNGCVFKDTVFVNVNPNVPVDAGLSNTICLGDSLEIGNNISPDSTVFSWNSPEVVLDSSAGETISFPKTSQWIFLTATNDTCSSIDSLFIRVNALPNIDIEPKDTSVCFGDSVTFEAKGALNYTWSINNDHVSESNQYELISFDSLSLILEGKDSNNCINRDTSIISVLSLPKIQLNNDTSICVNASLELSISGSDSYLWLNQEVSGVNDSNVIVKPDTTSSYIVRAKGANGCNLIDSTKVVVNDLPNVSVMSDTLICEGSNAYLWANGGVEYSWSPATFLNQTTGRQILSTPVNPILYKVVVTDGNKCIDSAETYVSLNVNPKADFTYTYIPSCFGFEVQFTDSSLLADSFHWTFRNGKMSNEMNPSHIFDFGTNVTTLLSVGNNDICFDSTQVDFNWNNISDFINVFPPNIITPNYDGLNDCFEVKVPVEFTECTDYAFYNRWGVKIFDTKDFKGDFCGINAYNNQEVSSGAYYFILRIGDYTVNGFVQVINE